MNAEMGHTVVPDRLIPIQDAAAFLGIALRTLERLVEAGKFPLPTKIANKRVYPISVITGQIERIKRGETWQG